MAGAKGEATRSNPIDAGDFGVHLYELETTSERFNRQVLHLQVQAETYGFSGSLMHLFSQPFVMIAHALDCLLCLNGRLGDDPTKPSDGPFGYVLGLIFENLGQLVGFILDVVFLAPAFVSHALIDEPLSYLIPGTDDAFASEEGGVAGFFREWFYEPYRRLLGVTSFVLGVVPEMIRATLNCYVFSYVIAGMIEATKFVGDMIRGLYQVFWDFDFKEFFDGEDSHDRYADFSNANSTPIQTSYANVGTQMPYTGYPHTGASGQSAPASTQSAYDWTPPLFESTQPSYKLEDKYKQDYFERYDVNCLTIAARLKQWSDAKTKPSVRRLLKRVVIEALSLISADKRNGDNRAKYYKRLKEATNQTSMTPRAKRILSIVELAKDVNGFRTKSDNELDVKFNEAQRELTALNALLDDVKWCEQYFSWYRNNVHSQHANTLRSQVAACASSAVIHSKSAACAATGMRSA